jgi:hypothetical protein
MGMEEKCKWGSQEMNCWAVHGILHWKFEVTGSLQVITVAQAQSIWLHWCTIEARAAGFCFIMELIELRVNSLLRRIFNTKGLSGPRYYTFSCLSGRIMTFWEGQPGWESGFPLKERLVAWIQSDILAFETGQTRTASRFFIILLQEWRAHTLVLHEAPFSTG